MAKIDPKIARKFRVRARLRSLATERPRLSVHRTSSHIYAQVIDDHLSVTVAAASTLEAGVKGEIKSGANIEAAKVVGRLVAERAKAAGIVDVRFDRGGNIFHGRVRALADAAREAGLNF
jgi:large subunit ribosomal protein L18